ncbi:hypothetical protein [Sphingomonas sp. TREG-RG-20F-R18-01]|uniref:hypothetical protein n=1 Tax=Sphingomonas sp. TREG-RG-20F-R18-01 TaxID=2914982 RepID=UPI001F55E28A|nr:hypothetical protein [Sphingomonas sp. TREG-RG-20F-R18-01]
MNVPIDTLAFAKSFEDAGFGHDQARVLANAFGTAQTTGREDLVTKDYLDARLAEMKQAIAESSSAMTRQLADNTAMLTRQIADNGRDISGRLWSTVTIIAGVSTAISATIGAGVALLLHAKGI